MISVIAYIVIISIEPFYRQDLFDESLTIIPDIQGIDTSQAQIDFWKTYSDLGLGLSVGGVPVYYLLQAKEKPRTAYYVILIIPFVLF